MYYAPHHQRFLVRHITAAQDGYPNYRSAINSAAYSRWYPLWKLLGERFRGGKGYSEYEIGRLIGLKEEYEQGFGRKG